MFQDLAKTFFVDSLNTNSLVIIMIIITLILFYQKRFRDSLAMMIVSLLTMGTIFYLKNLFKIPRPENALIDVDGYAFPSGHAGAGILVGILLYYFFYKNLSNRKRISFAIAIFIIVLAIGLSRIYFNVHTPFQVLAGYFFGAIFPLLYIWYRNK